MTSASSIRSILAITMLALHCEIVHAAWNQSCSCMPGDTCWPNAVEWGRFNSSVGGKLVAPVMLGAICHDPTYDEASCDYLRMHWTQPRLYDDLPSSIMAAAVANQTCDAFTSRVSPCLAGDTVAFAVNASDPSDFAKTIRFAKQKNIRLVIRNTGHDYFGKSTGRGALSIWTHYMKDVQYLLNYTSPSYSGPAIKLGAGIQVGEAYAAANKKGYLIVGGDCDTVGVVGGYTQGGGHSALSSIYGLGADQALEWEAVDGTGRLLKASRTENADLYWALSGGGGGTYGVVSSLTVKLYPDMPVSGVTLSFNLDAANPEPFYEAVSIYHQSVPTITDAGGMGIAEISNTSFLLTPLTLPNGTSAAAVGLLQPLLQKLDKLKVSYQINITESPDWLDFWTKNIKPNPTQLVHNAQYGGWMLPRSAIGEDLTAAVKKITNLGCTFVGLALNVSSHGGDNSVMPAWRDTAVNVILSTAWPEGADLNAMEKLAKTMTDECVPLLSSMTPNTGAYMNEADPSQPNWKKIFYGSNYDHLLMIKNRYDPDDLFYAPTAVGSDRWSVSSNGRLCRVL